MFYQSLNLRTVLVLLIVLGWTATGAAQSRIGEPVKSFILQNPLHLVLKGSTNKGGKVYFMFALPQDRTLNQKLPGFAGGLTLTTREGRIVGESFLLRLGDNFEAAKIVAVGTCLNVAYEAIGKLAPAQVNQREFEFNKFAEALDQALEGKAQNIHYQGYPMTVILSKGADDSILLAITPQASERTTK